MARQSKAAQELCERWNKLHPVGSAVTVTKDDGSKLETTTRSEAWRLRSGTPVVLVDGSIGCYKLTRVAARRVAT